MTVILTVVGIYLLLYIGLSLPPVQKAIKHKAETELSALLGGNLSIGQLEFYPFNRIVLHDVALADPDGEVCASIDKVGSGIDIWKLIVEQKIHVTYGEIIGLDARLWQQEKDGPLNIQFMIDALAPKDKNKPPTRFNLRLSSIILRKSQVSFDKRWAPPLSGKDKEKIDFNHLLLSDIQADINVPRLKNDDFDFVVRRLEMKEKSGFVLKNLSFKALVTDKKMVLNDLEIRLPNSSLKLPSLQLEYDGFPKIKESLEEQLPSLALHDAKITPSDLKAFFPPLKSLDFPLDIDIDADGSLSALNISEFKVSSSPMDIFIRGTVHNLDSLKAIEVSLEDMTADADLKSFSTFFNETFPPNSPAGTIVSRLQWLKLNLSAFYSSTNVSLDGNINTSIGQIRLSSSGEGSFERKTGDIQLNITAEDLDIQTVVPSFPLENISFHSQANISLLDKKDPILKFSPLIQGSLELSIDEMEYNGEIFSDVQLAANKSTDSFDADLVVVSEAIDASIKAFYEGESMGVTGSVNHFMPGLLGLTSNKDMMLSTEIDAMLSGKSIGDLDGKINIDNFSFRLSPTKVLPLHNLEIESYHPEDSEERIVTLQSDYITGKMNGNFNFADFPKVICSVVANIVPSWVPEKWERMDNGQTPLMADFNFDILPNNDWLKFLNLPVTMITEIPIKGNVDSSSGKVNLDIDIPYLQQGAKTLIHDASLSVAMNAADNMGRVNLKGDILGKNDDISIALDLMGIKDRLEADIKWDFNRQRNYNGTVSLTGNISHSLPLKPEAKPEKIYDIGIRPSSFQVNDTTWNVGEGAISYTDKKLVVHNVTAFRDRQFVTMDGCASALDTDTLAIHLRDIDLDYIFNTLKINYVTFGGNATGDIYATSLFTKEPVAYTDNLNVKGLHYNGALMGDALIKSRWLNEEKEVSLWADIRDQGHRAVLLDGGIWVTRDSLSLAFDADRVNVKFMTPFFEAFASDLEGRASGKVKIYGTFADVNLEGKAFADTISMRVNYTNVVYAGSDSVIMTPGKIMVPGFRIYDQFGHSGYVTGLVEHRYFHEPKFEFTIRDCKNLFCFNTDEKINPRWYGQIYGSGGGTIKGLPGYVRITVDMTTEPNSEFTFVLDETTEAIDYQFLSFTDKRKEEELAAMVNIQDKEAIDRNIKQQFRKKVTEEEKVRESIFAMDLRGTVNRNAKLTLIMDPVAGDKITCRGKGAINVGYNSENDDFTMFGKYVLSEGNYKFSLQDVILKDFDIREGSSISFNGDPYNAALNIDAIYKVNTNIADLDKSFATDKELNRTNVPVDAILKVDGTLENPDISFDIELPTLTQDVLRKVKSIISTDDMMSMQIIYLLALGRFYTPEYMGGSSNGGELTAVASTTLSSQLSNMLGQLTNAVSVSPTFRSDKGDFSDFEFDLGLSSRLFNNRLLINGNLGYRDKSTSSTTFVGDFDIEYLLNRNGNLRLKAYNHFNDQNYYLKSALTTQGLGIVFKRDFNSITDLLKGRPKKVSPDTITTK